MYMHVRVRLAWRRTSLAEDERVPLRLLLIPRDHVNVVVLVKNTRLPASLPIYIYVCMYVCVCVCVWVCICDNCGHERKLAHASGRMFVKTFFA